MGIPRRRVEMRRHFDKKATHELAKLRAERDIDPVHYHYPREHYTTLLAKKYNKKICVVCTNHFVLASGFVARFSNRIVGRRQNQMIAVCNKGREQLIANDQSADHIQVVFNAVDLDAWAGNRSQPTLRAELGLGGSRSVMLCAFRFAEDEGYKYLIDPVRRLAELYAVPFTLVLARDGPLLGPAKAQVQELGPKNCVKFVGFRKDIKSLYRGSNLYVNFSQYEALSFLVIEAMAAGLPVIAASMRGNSDIVNGEMGRGTLMGYDNPNSMVVVTRCLLEDPTFAARCRESARRTTEDKSEIHKMARTIYGMYEKILHG